MFVSEDAQAYIEPAHGTVSQEEVVTLTLAIAGKATNSQQSHNIAKEDPRIQGMHVHLAVKQITHVSEIPYKRASAPSYTGAWGQLPQDSA